MAVAEDYERALKRVVGIERDSIWHLTNMARDGVEHAREIAHVIEADIKNTRPQRKLVPFYILDSIVKNVGSPFNVYFGFALYTTFFNAYTASDAATRRSMEAMLKTWKQPVPNTLDTDPVFPVTITSPIETALQTAQQNAQMKTQTPYAQYPHQLRQQLPRQAHALSPRPPTNNGSWRGQPPPFHPQTNGYFGPQQFSNGSPASVPTFSSPPSTIQQPDPLQHQALLADIDTLVQVVQNKLSYRLWDNELRSKLNSTMQLQQVLQTQHLPSAQWTTIQATVASLLSEHSYDQPGQMSLDAYSVPGVGPYGRPSSATPQHQYQQPPPQHQQQPYAQTYAPDFHPRPTPAPQPPPLDPSTLAALTALFDGQRGTSVQPVPRSNASRPESSHMSSPPASTGMPSIVPNINLNLADVAGLYQQMCTPNQMRDGIKESHSAYQPPSGPIPRLGDAHQTTNELRLDSGLLKVPHPELCRSLWQGQSLCRTCGRRFANTIEGKARKTRHLDYHFRANMRCQDASRGAAVATRSWYMDEAEWIKFREVDDADEASNDKPVRDRPPAGQGSEKGSGTVKERLYVRIPADRGSVNAFCPICQEGFEDTWRADVQEWVWPDCVRGKDGRFFHDSCMESYREDELAAKDREAKVRNTAGPEVEMPSVDEVREDGSVGDVTPTREGSVGKKRKLEEIDT